MIDLSIKAGLREPDFKQEDVFKVIIWRKEQSTGEVTGEATGEATGEVPEAIRRMILVLNGEMKKSEIQDIIGLKHEDYFRTNYIIPSIELGYIEMKYPQNPKHPNQRYRLTEKGQKLRKSLTIKS